MEVGSYVFGKFGKEMEPLWFSILLQALVL